jgi:hypothetical protein
MGLVHRVRSTNLEIIPRCLAEIPTENPNLLHKIRGLTHKTRRNPLKHIEVPPWPRITLYSSIKQNLEGSPGKPVKTLQTKIWQGQRQLESLHERAPALHLAALWSTPITIWL